MSAVRLGIISLYAVGVLVSLLATTGLSDGFSLVALAFALGPAGIYLAATKRPTRTAVIGLGVLLLAQAALYAAAVPGYDDDAQGALLFFFVPFWGALGLAIGWGIVAWIGGLRGQGRGL